MKPRLSYLFLLCFFLSLPVKSSAQELLVDSLKSVLQQEDLSSHQHIMTLSDLADVVSYEDSALSRAMYLNKKAISLAHKHHDADGLTFAWSQQVVLESRAGNKKLALQAVDSATHYARNASPLMHGIALYRKGFMQNIQHHPEKAFQSWQKALRYLSEPKGALYQAGIYYLKYGIYAERGELKKAASYANIALKRAKQSGDPNMLVAVWQIKGTSYLDRFFKNKKHALLDSATHAYQKSIQIFKKKKNRLKDPVVVVLSAINLANIYLDYYPKEYLQKVLSNVNMALKISIENGAKVMEINSYQVVSRLNRHVGDLKRAEKALLKAKVLVDSLDPPNYYSAKNIYRLLAQVNEQQKDYEDALNYYKQFIVFYKKVFDAKQYQTIQQLETKYQTKKKEATLRHLKQQNAFQQKKTRLYIAIAIIAILGLLGLFLAYRFRLKYSLQREKSNKEEAARLKAEQELMQQQKEQLQTELMAGALQVEHKNELLHDLKEKLRGQSGSKATRKLERIINEEMRMDENFEDIRMELKELHPEFFDRLQEKAHKKLTQSDLKYASYFYLKLSTKEIAQLMKVAPKSVRMAKYRLKQKLDLGKEEDLDEFLQRKGK